MKIYTRRGDAGETDLFGGPRVHKDEMRVEAYGAVDELNAALGAAAAASLHPDLRELAQHAARCSEWHAVVPDSGAPAVSCRCRSVSGRGARGGAASHWLSPKRRMRGWWVCVCVWGEGRWGWRAVTVSSLCEWMGVGSGSSFWCTRCAGLRR